MSTSQNSWADRLANASASGAGNFITRHGRYKMVVVEVSGKVGEGKGFKGESIAFRFKVVEAAKNGYTTADGTHEVGDTVSTVFNLTQTGAEGRMKALVLALLGKKEQEVSKEQMKMYGLGMLEPKQPFVGKFVTCETAPFSSKNVTNGVGQAWSFVPQSPESFAEERVTIFGA